MSTEDKPSRNEEEYFARLNAELMNKRRAQLDVQRQNQERISHYNKCPKCGTDLTEQKHAGVTIDSCARCGGLWLDKGELEIIEEFDRKSYSFMKSFLRMVR